MQGKFTEPCVIIDHNKEPVSLLPAGFLLSDDRWEIIWQQFEEKGESLTHDDLRKLPPNEPTRQINLL